MENGFDTRSAVRALKRADPVMAQLIERVGPLRLELGDLSSPFSALLRAIAHQQLNGKAANTILGLVHALFPGCDPLQAEHLSSVTDDALRGAGLSRSKIAAVRDLAAKTLDGTVPDAATLRRMGNEEIIERLTQVRGIGRWTVEMLLMFRLGRPDVLPVDDYGLRKGYALAFRKRDLPTPKQLGAYGARWSPFRTAASWYLWRAVELPPETWKGRR